MFTASAKNRVHERHAKVHERHAKVRSQTSYVTWILPYGTRQTSHITQHTAHGIRHTTHGTRHTAHGTRHTAYGTRHMAYGTRHTAHCTRHTTYGKRTRHAANSRTQLARHYTACTAHVGRKRFHTLMVLQELAVSRVLIRVSVRSGKMRSSQATIKRCRCMINCALGARAWRAPWTEWYSPTSLCQPLQEGPPTALAAFISFCRTTSQNPVSAYAFEYHN
jgi:hypothetical protein